jgi:hypothetical protein
MKYRIEFEVDAAQVQTILSVLTDDGVIFRCNPVEAPVAHAAPTETRRAHATHRRNDPSGLRAYEHVERILQAKGKPTRLKEIAKELRHSTSFSHSTASPALDELKKKGRAENDGNGIWWLKNAANKV